MIVEINLNKTSQAIIHDCINAYTKGPMYCVLIREVGGDFVYKYPIKQIFRIKETYK